MIGCAVLGATGTVGQHFIRLLAGHPSFQLRSVVASDRSVGQTYAAATIWRHGGDVPGHAAELVVEDVEALLARTDIRVVFGAMPGGLAGPVETRLAEAGFAVFTNARDHRMDANVPLLIPEINADAIEMVRGKAGFIVANGNCSAIVLTMALAPLQRAFGIEHVEVTTMQAISGAGHPGVASLDIMDNIVPLIRGEEEKMRIEPQKTLGSLRDGLIVPAAFTVEATCTRVPVTDGHFESVVVRLARPVAETDVRSAWAGFVGPEAVAGLPSAPQHPIHVLDGDRPQPRLDRDREAGMSISVGRIRVQGDNVRFVCLGHNTVRGAAGQSILNAEYAAATGCL